MKADPILLAEPAAQAQALAPAAPARTRPLYWSVRRELWENRSIYLAPLGVGAFAVVGLVIHAITMPSHMPGMLANDPAPTGSASVTYRVVAMLMLVAWFVTAAFYCLEALSSERRDRGILFWKSLPVSDRTTVLSKAIVPLAILPAVTFAVIVAMQLLLLLLSAAALLLYGDSPGPLWRELQLFRMWLAVAYATVAMVLWHAPVHAFLLLVSGWARRTAALWAVLPLLALVLLEKLTMDTMHVGMMVEDRVIGWHGAAFTGVTGDSIPFHPQLQMTPGRFLGQPGLWIGLVLAAAFLAAAMRLRRYREPI